MICKANQLADFYMRTTLAFNGLNFVWFGWLRKFPSLFEISKAVMSKESLHVLVVINIFWNVFGKAGTGITLILINYHSMIQVVTNVVEGTVQKKQSFH